MTTTSPTTAAAMIAEFHRVAPPGGLGLRARLIDEEATETVEALDSLDAFRQSPVLDGSTLHVAAVAKELADLVYVAYGTAYSLGIPLDAVIAEVHRSNMTKFGPDGHPLEVRPDGKVAKGPAYLPPDIEGVLAAQEDTDD